MREKISKEYREALERAFVKLIEQNIPSARDIILGGDDLPEGSGVFRIHCFTRTICDTLKDIGISNFSVVSAGGKEVLVRFSIGKRAKDNGTFDITDTLKNIQYDSSATSFEYRESE